MTRAGGGEDGFGRAVILLELENLRLRDSRARNRGCCGCRRRAIGRSTGPRRRPRTDFPSCAAESARTSRYCTRLVSWYSSTSRCVARALPLRSSTSGSRSNRSSVRCNSRSLKSIAFIARSRSLIEPVNRAPARRRGRRRRRFRRIAAGRDGLILWPARFARAPARAAASRPAPRPRARGASRPSSRPRRGSKSCDRSRARRPSWRRIRAQAE